MCVLRKCKWDELYWRLASSVNAEMRVMAGCSWHALLNSALSVSWQRSWFDKLVELLVKQLAI